jgi:uncharacterized 2Fe-2S/4Fe-4S cluster protein (DUF4445 family)
MFRNKSGDITDINLLEINNTIKGGFPKIKICDTEITKKILEKKPREFSNNKIISIKDMLKMKKKTESSLNLLSDPQMINSLQSSFASNNEIMNIIKDTNDEINGISIDLIIGRSKINNKELSDRLEKSKSSKSKSSKSKSSKSKSSKSKSSKSKKSKN